MSRYRKKNSLDSLMSNSLYDFVLLYGLHDDCGFCGLNDFASCLRFNENSMISHPFLRSHVFLTSSPSPLSLTSLSSLICRSAVGPIQMQIPSGRCLPLITGPGCRLSAAADAAWLPSDAPGHSATQAAICLRGHSRCRRRKSTGK